MAAGVHGGRHARSRGVAPTAKGSYGGADLRPTRSP